jgi:hypothetical protein
MEERGASCPLLRNKKNGGQPSWEASGQCRDQTAVAVTTVNRVQTFWCYFRSTETDKPQPNKLLDVTNPQCQLHQENISNLKALFSIGWCEGTAE